MKRNEKLALAQLKKKQLLREQELQRKMTELQYERDFMEAQIKEERATVSIEVYEQAEEGNKIDSVERNRDNMDPVLKELELSPTSVPTCTRTCTFGTITCLRRHL